MIREIVKINEDLCNGCGLCVPNCHEGALQIIDNKARLISDLMCDGLGACLGHCPEGAITIEKREAQPYNEIEVIKEMVSKGKNTVIAHLKHLREHNETAFLHEGIEYLKSNRNIIHFNLDDVLNEVTGNKQESAAACKTGGCPGSRAVVFDLPNDIKLQDNNTVQKSQLSHWPIQLHLINPVAQNFAKSDLLLAADCSAFSLGNFHSQWLKGKTLVIACPKLDRGTEIYINKIAALIDEAKVNTITVLMMEVPCCGGLLSIVKEARQMAYRNVPVKSVILSIKGEVLRDDWV